MRCTRRRRASRSRSSTTAPISPGKRDHAPQAIAWRCCSCCVLCALRRQAEGHARRRADAEDARDREVVVGAGRRHRGQRGAGDRGLPQVPRRARRARRSAREAMRRLGDLEMDRADNRSAIAARSRRPDYRAAITRYQDFLKAYPKDPGNDRVLYQLARAHEQGGDLETALKTLDRLVARLPADARTATRRSSAAASCCSRMRDYAERRAGLRDRARERPDQRPTTNARCTCRAGRCSSRGGSKTRCTRSSACST